MTTNSTANRKVWIDDSFHEMVINSKQLWSVLDSLTHTSEQARFGESLTFIGYHRIGKLWIECGYKHLAGHKIAVTFERWALEYDNDGKPDESGTSIASLVKRMAS